MIISMTCTKVLIVEACQFFFFEEGGESFFMVLSKSLSSNLSCAIRYFPSSFSANANATSCVTVPEFFNTASSLNCSFHTQPYATPNNGRVLFRKTSKGKTATYLLNNELNPERSVATKVHSSTFAGQQNKKSPSRCKQDGLYAHSSQLKARNLIPIQFRLERTFFLNT